MTNPNIWIFGAGSWGTALAHHLAGMGNQVHLWCYEAEICQAINRGQENSVYLPGIKLNSNITAHTGSDLSNMASAKLIMLVVPSQFFRAILHRALPHLSAQSILISCTKGLEPQTNYTMCEVAQDVLPSQQYSLACLSGPSFAREVALKAPTALTVASTDHSVAHQIQAILSNDYLRLYTSQDIIGVELGGAIKNPLAIAAGMLAGLELGQNPLAALITRGLAEITRLAVTRGAKPATLAGLSGLGDLVLTCTSPQSRNFTVGFRLAQGESLEQILSSTPAVAEGVKNAKTILELAQSLGVEMPIISAVYRVLYEKCSVSLALQELMTRSLKPEYIILPPLSDAGKLDG